MQKYVKIFTMQKNLQFIFTIMENLSKRLKELRTTLGLNLSEFAKKMDTKHQNIMVIEAGTSKPGAEILSRISETYCVNLNWLVTGEGEMFLGGVKPELPTTPIKVVKEVKTVVSNEIVDVGFLQKMLDFANKEKADLFVMVQNLLSENQRLTADIRK